MSAFALIAAMGVAVSTATPVGFDVAVQRALEKHPALRLAADDVARADAQVEQARSGSLPSLGVNLVGTRLDADRVLNDRVIAGANQLSGNVQLIVPLVAPQRWAVWKRSAASAGAVAKNAEDARRQVALNAGRIWLQVLAQQRVVASQARALTTAQAHLAYAKDRRAAGIGSELDEIRASQEVAVARQQLAGAQSTLARAQEFLGVAMGADEPFSAEDSEPSLGFDANGIDATAVERTDVAAAKERLEAAKVANAWDFSDYLPTLSAVLQPGYQNPPTLTVPLWSFQGQLVLSLPLYDGGLRYGQQHERQALARQAATQLELLQRQASAEVRAALAQVKASDEALAAARDATRQADRTLELAQQAFKAGASTNLEVIDAERRARDAATSVALAEDSARQARLEVLAASGAFPAK